MPTFEVEVRSRLLDGPRRLRVPAPDEGRARRRGARRVLALAQPDLGPTLGAEEFNRVAGTIAAGTKATQVAA
jgi:hypothetical protein